MTAPTFKVIEDGLDIIPPSDLFFILPEFAWPTLEVDLEFGFWWTALRGDLSALAVETGVGYVQFEYEHATERPSPTPQATETPPPPTATSHPPNQTPEPVDTTTPSPPPNPTTTPTPPPTNTATPTFTVTPTATVVPTFTSTQTPLPTNTPTRTPTPIPPTITPTTTPTQTMSPNPTETPNPDQLPPVVDEITQEQGCTIPGCDLVPEAGYVIRTLTIDAHDEGGGVITNYQFTTTGGTVPATYHDPDNYPNKFALKCTTGSLVTVWITIHDNANPQNEVCRRVVISTGGFNPDPPFVSCS